MWVVGPRDAATGQLHRGESGKEPSLASHFVLLCPHTPSAEPESTMGFRLNSEKPLPSICRRLLLLGAALLPLSDVSFGSASLRQQKRLTMGWGLGGKTSSLPSIVVTAWPRRRTRPLLPTAATAAAVTAASEVCGAPGGKGESRPS